MMGILLQHWSVLYKGEGESWPVGRNRHAATCLGYGDDPQLLVTGGTDKDNKVLDDSWILDLQAGRWREVRSQREPTQKTVIPEKILCTLKM